jgi:hypothetical protein
VQRKEQGREVESEATNEPEEERVHNQMKKREDSTLLYTYSCTLVKNKSGWQREED